MVKDSDLSLFMSLDAAGKPQAWACRGAGKGCNRNRFRTSKKQCDDCYGPLPNTMTVGEVVERLKKGDA